MPTGAAQMYPDQSLYPAEQRARRWCAPSTMRCCAPTRSARLEGRPGPYWLAPIVADAEAGFGGIAERLRDHEGHDRGRRRRGALRRPALLGQEVRPSGRQGRGARPRVHPEADRRPPGGRCPGRPHRPDRPDRRRCRAAPAERRRPSRRAVPDRRPDRGRLLPLPRRHGRGHRARPGVCALCRCALVRNFGARFRAGAPLRRGHSCPLSRQAAGVQLLAVVPLEEAADRSPDRAVPDAARRIWATSSSS